MKKSEAESRRSELRQLNERKDFDERETAESSRAFIMLQLTASGRADVR